MTGLAFASAPLYALFCKVTGFGGEPRTENVQASSSVSDKTILIRFDANVSPDLPWRFAPAERQVRLHLGEQRLAYYEALNRSDRAITGMAVFNVSPFKAAPYFNKIDCFCFTEQSLAAGQDAVMPVLFYVDPAIAEDPETRDVRVITLSYTFYPAEGSDEEAAAPASGGSAAAELQGRRDKGTARAASGS